MKWKVGSNLRKVRRDSLLRTDNTDSNSFERRTRQSQSVGPPVILSSRNEENSSSNSDVDYSNNQENTTWKRTGFQSHPQPIPVSKSHQFITSSQSGSQFDRPEWQRALIDRRRAATNEIKPES